MTQSYLWNEGHHQQRSLSFSECLNAQANGNLGIHYSLRCKDVHDLSVLVALVVDAMNAPLKLVSSVGTITLNNSGEFAAHERVVRAVNADFFSPNPTPATSEGNENANGIIRRIWPEKIPLGDLAKKNLRTMELLINTMQRKVLGGRTPLKLYTRQSVALTT